MGLNTLGLGIILSLRDGASVPANRAAASLGQLDATAQRFSSRFNTAMATAFEGMNMFAAGLMAAAAPIGFVKSTLKTQQALAYVASSGVEDLGRLKAAAEDFTNTWAGSTQESFLNTAYEIKSGLYELSDAMVTKMTTTTGVLAKATKSTMDEIQSLVPIMWGILKPSRGGITDEAFMNELAGALAQSVKIYRATGKNMGDAFSQATAIATQQGISMEEQFAVLGRLQQTMTGSEAGTKLRALAVNAPRAVELAKKHNVPIQLTDDKGMLLPIINILENARDIFSTKLGPEVAKGISASLNNMEISDDNVVSNVAQQYGKLTADSMEGLRKIFGSREATSTIINLLPYIDQLKDDTLQIKDAMSKGLPVALDMAEKAANNMGDAWEVFVQRVNNLKQSIGESLFGMFGPGLKALGLMVVALQKFVKANPWLIRIASAIAMVAGSALMLTGILFILSAAFQIVNASVALMKSRMVLLRAEFLKFLITLWPLLLLAGTLYFAFKTNFMGISDAFMNSIKKIKEFFNMVKLVFQGLGELIHTFSNDKGTISADLHDKLVDAGLWDLVKTLFMVYTRLRYLWEGIKAGFKDTWTFILNQVLKPIGAGIRDYVLKPLGALLAKFGIVFPALQKLINPTQENANAWKEVGYWIGVALAILATVGTIWKIIAPIIKVAKFIGTIVTKLGWLWKAIAWIGKLIFGLGKWLWTAFMWIAGIVAGILGIPVWVAALIVAAVIAIIVLIVIFRKQVWAFLQTIFWGIVGVFATIGIVLFQAIMAVVLIIIAAVGIIIGIIWGIVNVVISIVAAIVGVFLTCWTIIAGIWMMIFEVIKGIVLTIVAVVKAIFTGDFTTLGETLKGIWGGVWQNIQDICAGVVQKIIGIWDGIKGVLAGVWGSLKDTASGFFNWIGEKFAWVGSLVDKIKGVWSSMGGKISEAWNAITVKGHATGGLFNGPSIIGIGEQPNVKEAAIPLSGRHMLPFANAIASAMPEPVLDGPKNGYRSTPVNNVINNNYTTNNNNQNQSGASGQNGSNLPPVQITVPVKIDGREVARATADYVDLQNRRK